MSVLTAIFQAIAQAVCWIFPLSESGHSALFHNFANQSADASSVLTGVVHIGIGVGIVLSMYKLFFGLFKEFIGTFSDLFKKQLSSRTTTPRRSFMYMTLISLAPMLLLLIPTGHGLLYTVLKNTAYNSTVLEEGLFFAITGLLVILAGSLLSKPSKNKNITWLYALVVGVCNIFFVTIGGFSLTVGAFAILILFGVSKKLAVRYPFVLSAPVLVVMGIVEICTASVSASVASIIIAIILSILVSFVLSRLFKLVIKNAMYHYFGIYDIVIGFIAFVIGIFELILK